MSTDINEILDRLKAVCEAATDGPFTWKWLAGWMLEQANTNDPVVLLEASRDFQPDENERALIVASLNAVPALVEALERLTPEICNKCGGHGCAICDYDGCFEPTEGPMERLTVISDALAPLKEHLP